MTILNDALFPLTSLGDGVWTTEAGAEWRNPNGPLWGGYSIGLCLAVVAAEPEAQGEPLSITLTYVAGLRAGTVEVRTRRLRQGGSVGVWEVELRPAGATEVSVHAIVTMARRPATPPFAFARMPDAPDPDGLPSQARPGGSQHFGSRAFERRTSETFPIEPAPSSRSMAWVRPKLGPWTKILLGMLTDSSPPRAFYALGHTVMTTTVTLTIYLHATAEEIAAAGEDYLLVEYEGRVGGGGATDERSSYWRRDGKLLATSEQLLWYREYRSLSPE
ncbi:thioesterase family protein [Phenylobacterium sp.]|jgi:acyl-coenzyme A thioesterase PaaI-like protein|uniref:thioesterase family protein n=1 Tax=Phenylobacterium sp. TaxID=1871053 RepID=UPI002E36379D|nr:thioesterase family protein [Phenylobacterium sp.]HEX2560399.1 thioesterase family protein [Phenylobacterium sp.]